MNHLQSKRFASSRRALASSGAIEWEELPSLALSLVTHRAARPASGLDAANSEFPTASNACSSWDDTLPASLDELASHAPPAFREVFDGGLATREVTEPDVFRHFFGNPPGR